MRIMIRKSCGGSMFRWCLLTLSISNSRQHGWLNRLFIVLYFFIVETERLPQRTAILPSLYQGGGPRVYSPRGREERISDIHHQVWLGSFKTKISARENKRLFSTISMTCTVKSPLVQGLHQAKLAGPVETWARFLSISLTLIEFFSSIYFYCISGSGHGDPHFIWCMPYIALL